MLPFVKTRLFYLVPLFLCTGLAGCLSNEAKTGSASASDNISISVERLSDIGGASRICELAAAISAKQPGKFGVCLNAPAVMARSLEEEFLNAFQKNPACKGIALVVGTDDPAKAATAGEQQRFQYARYRVYFHLKVTNEGYVNWDDSDWQLERIGGGNPVHGSMNHLDHETTAFCTVVRGEGGSVR